VRNGLELMKNCVDSGVPDNHVGDTVANGLAFGRGVPDKGCLDSKSSHLGKEMETETETGQAYFVMNSHVSAEGLACSLNLGPVICEVGTEADKSCIHNGVPDNHVGETGANLLACGSNLEEVCISQTGAVEMHS